MAGPEATDSRQSRRDAALLAWSVDHGYRLGLVEVLMHLLAVDLDVVADADARAARAAAQDDRHPAVDVADGDRQPLVVSHDLEHAPLGGDVAPVGAVGQLVLLALLFGRLAGLVGVVIASTPQR